MNKYERTGWLVWIEWDKPEPTLYDGVLVAGKTYVAPVFGVAWALLLRLLWEAWLGAFALFIAGVALAEQWGRKRDVRQVMLWDERRAA